jgi:hypothetical protein
LSSPEPHAADHATRWSGQSVEYGRPVGDAGTQCLKVALAGIGESMADDIGMGHGVPAIGAAMIGGRIACQIVKNIVTSTRLVDDLPSVAIEAMLDYFRENQRQDRPQTDLDRAFKEVRAAYIKYGEVALREAQARERRLLSGITGEPPKE